MLGFKTIGNATLVVFDDEPLLATDPWLGEDDHAYNGSWNLSHTIPTAERNEIHACRFVWFSHGHPDHLNPLSVKHFHSRTVLLPDHRGGRIRFSLEADGFNVKVLPDRKWVALSPRVRVLCLPDLIQDAVLLVEIGNDLVIDMNDSSARGHHGFIRGISSGYERVFLLRLSGYGDADMIHLFYPDGSPVKPHRRQPGSSLSRWAARVGANHVIPFSSFHRYQREDSVWANEHTTPLFAYGEGFDTSAAELLTPFIEFDCASGSSRAIDPQERRESPLSPSHFGDSWSDELEPSDFSLLDAYFQRKALLHKWLNFLEFRVGDTVHRVDLRGPKHRGIGFHVPAYSLMRAIRGEFFDDLLIGNYMKTTLYEVDSLYEPNFNYAVAKYGDNGRAESMAEVRRYLRDYRSRAGFEFIRNELRVATRIHLKAPARRLREAARRLLAPLH